MLGSDGEVSSFAKLQYQRPTGMGRKGERKRETEMMFSHIKTRVSDEQAAAFKVENR